MRQFCIETNLLLSLTAGPDWAKVFVERRMEFSRRFGRGLVFSTSHGVDFFHNVLVCMAREPWEEKGYLGDNFRKLITSSQ